MSAPLELWRGPVRSEWIDEFGHVNIAHYLTICDQANWAFWNLLNEPATMEERDGHEYAIVENHIQYLDELAEAEQIRVTTQLLAHDAKRFILFHQVYKADGSLSAMNEAKFIGFNLQSRGIEAWSDTVLARLGKIQAEHDQLDRPRSAGAGIVLGRR